MINSPYEIQYLYVQDLIVLAPTIRIMFPFCVARLQTLKGYLRVDSTVGLVCFDPLYLTCHC